MLTQQEYNAAKGSIDEATSILELNGAITDDCPILVTRGMLDDLVSIAKHTTDSTDWAWETFPPPQIIENLRHQLNNGFPGVPMNYTVSRQSMEEILLYLEHMMDCFRCVQSRITLAEITYLASAEALWLNAKASIEHSFSEAGISDAAYVSSDALAVLLDYIDAMVNVAIQPVKYSNHDMEFELTSEQVKDILPAALELYFEQVLIPSISAEPMPDEGDPLPDEIPPMLAPDLEATL